MNDDHTGRLDTIWIEPKSLKKMSLLLMEPPYVAYFPR
jgi:hypothetical protein